MRERRRIRLWVVIGGLSAAIGVGIAPTAEAQDGEAAAREAFDEAAHQFELRNYELALEGFETSYRLAERNPRRALILYNIARAHHELGHYDDAIRTYERFLLEAPPEAADMRRAQDHVRELRARLGRRLDRGALSPLDLSGIVLASAGAAGVLAAIPTGVVTLNDEAELDALCGDGACSRSAQGLIDEAQTLSVVTDVLWVAGVSVAAVGAALLAAGRIAAENAETQVSLACGEVGCVGTLQARF